MASVLEVLELCFAVLGVILMTAIFLRMLSGVDRSKGQQKDLLYVLSIGCVACNMVFGAQELIIASGQVGLGSLRHGWCPVVWTRYLFYHLAKLFMFNFFVWRLCGLFTGSIFAVPKSVLLTFKIAIPVFFIGHTIFYEFVFIPAWVSLSNGSSDTCVQISKDKTNMSMLISVTVLRTLVEFLTTIYILRTFISRLLSLILFRESLNARDSMASHHNLSIKSKDEKRQEPVEIIAHPVGGVSRDTPMSLERPMTPSHVDSVTAAGNATPVGLPTPAGSRPGTPSQCHHIDFSVVSPTGMAGHGLPVVADDREVTLSHEGLGVTSISPEETVKKSPRSKQMWEKLKEKTRRRKKSKVEDHLEKTKEKTNKFLNLVIKMTNLMAVVALTTWASVVLILAPLGYMRHMDFLLVIDAMGNCVALYLSFKFADDMYRKICCCHGMFFKIFAEFFFVCCLPRTLNPAVAAAVRKLKASQVESVAAVAVVPVYVMSRLYDESHRHLPP